MSRITQLLFQDKPEWVGPKIVAYLAANPTLLVTIAYLLISGLGLLYELVLFSQFGVNVLDYSEAADFFLAAFKRPDAFLTSFAIAATFVFYRVLANYARKRKSKALRIVLLFFSWAGMFRREILIPIGLIYFFTIFAVSAEAEARRIVFHSTEVADLSTRFGSPSDYKLIPIGATERFMFGIQMSDDIISARQTSTLREIKPIVIAIPFTNIVKIKYNHVHFSSKVYPSDS